MYFGNYCVYHCDNFWGQENLCPYISQVTCDSYIVLGSLMGPDVGQKL